MTFRRRLGGDLDVFFFLKSINVCLGGTEPHVALSLQFTLLLVFGEVDDLGRLAPSPSSNLNPAAGPLTQASAYSKRRLQ
jgi:hypothetical protein